MNTSIELIKKIGAGAVILVLVLMMGITFSSQPVSEITAIIAGGSGIGEYRGEELSTRLYLMVREGCKQRFAEYGEIPEIFIDQCASREIRNYYVLPYLGEQIGLNVSDEFIEKQLISDVRDRFQSQSQYSDPDDRLSMQEIYVQELQNLPVDIRKRDIQMKLIAQSLGNFPYPESLSRSMLDAADIKVDLRMIHYDNAEMLASIGKDVIVTEEMIKERYESKPADKDGKKAEYNASRELIENEIKNELRQKNLSEIKAQLGNLKDKSLNRIEEITGITPVNISGVALEELKQVRPSVNSNIILNLADPDLLLNLGEGAGSKKVFGPIQSGERTVYLELVNVKIPSQAPDNRRIEVQSRQGSMDLASGLLVSIIENEAQRGGFNLKQIKSE